jgi:hypothetical protein
VDRLPTASARRFRRLFDVNTAPAPLLLPAEMRGWVREAFGSVEAVENQAVVRVANLATAEETVFNTLRADRPLEVVTAGLDEMELEALLETGGDPFCQPEEQTPEDVFGRVYGHHSLTASNIAKLDAYHGVVIFREHHPLRFGRDQVSDYLHTGLAWGERVLKTDPAARYWLLWWNALWKSGASIVHGHAQVSARRQRHYARVEQLRQSAERYRASACTDYFEDLLEVHDALGLAFHHGTAAVFPSLTPIKEREVWVVDQGGLTEPLVDLAYRVLDVFVTILGVQSFNVSYWRPPLGALEPAWRDFPHIVRIVDRGSVETPMADIGGLELFGCASVTHDPFDLIAQIAW